MEKLSTIFSIVTHDHELMKWFWLFATLPVGIWHIFYFPSEKERTEKQLLEISPNFKGINGDYLGFSLVVAFLLIGFPYLLLAPGWDKWAMQKFGVEFYPSVVIISAGYGIYQALFALWKGVYPMARSLSYVYDESVKIRRVAKYQILIAISAFIFVILFFFVTV